MLFSIILCGCLTFVPSIALISAAAHVENNVAPYACFTTPPPPSEPAAARAPTIPAWSTPPCRILAALLETTPPWDVQWVSGEGLNHILGLTQGGFATDSYALQFRVSPQFNTRFHGPDELVRFSTDDARARGGSWWTPLQIVRDPSGRRYDAQQVVAVLALPGPPPSMMAHSVGVAPGTVGYFGRVAPAFGQPGGGVQFWFPAAPVWSSTIDPFETPR